MQRNKSLTLFFASSRRALRSGQPDFSYGSALCERECHSTNRRIPCLIPEGSAELEE